MGKTEKRIGSQTPTQSIVLPYEETRGQEAIELYNSSGRTALEWQEHIIEDIMAVNEDGLWVHTKFGEAVPRRNGKNEVVVIRELWGIIQNAEHVLHTAHRTTTSTAASRRLVERLKGAFCAVGLSNETTSCVLGVADGELRHYDTEGEEIDAAWYTKDEVRRMIREEHFGSWAQAYCYMWSKQ